MPLVSLIVLLALIGFIMYLVNTYIPMGANIKNVINITVLIVVVFWLLSVFGILPNVNAVRVGR